MKKQLSFVLLAAALVAAAALNWPSGAQQHAVPAEQTTAYQTAQNQDAAGPESIRMLANNMRLDAGPRIIHVPQPGETSAITNDATDIDDSALTDDVEIQQPNRPPAKPRRVVTPAPRRVLPPAGAAPKRTVLSAPPAAGELTPIYPTPRWRANDNPSAPAQTGNSDASALDLPPDTDTSLPR